MQRLTYRVYVDVPDAEPIESARRATEDALEALTVNGRTVEYQLIGTVSGLPDRDPCGAADRWSCVCRTGER